jgi:RNA polymerase sigma factor (TIGR02999 family)
MSEVTRILDAISRGEPRAVDELLPLVYEELRKLAAARLHGDAAGQSLQATALVHEAYLRIVGAGSVSDGFKNRAYFFAAAAEAMRRILIERARQRAAGRHGGGRRRVPLADVVAAAEDSPDDLIDLDAALTRLATEDSSAAKVATLRLFGGLSVEDAATALGLARATAYRHWTFARAWLRCELADND